MGNQVTRQAVISEQQSINRNQKTEEFALFGPDGTPVSFDALLVQTGADVVLTGYEAGEAAAIEATDTVNEAVAKLEAGLADIAPDTGADVVLTGYVAGVADDIEATDTVNEALAKLEARIATLEA